MLRSLLTTTALVALLAGGTAVAQTDQASDPAKTGTTAESQTSAGTTGATAGGAAGTEMKAEGDAATDMKAADTDAKPAPAASDTATNAGADAPAQSASRATGFVTEQDGEEVLATEYIGQTVYNGQDESIGKINDLVMDKDGRLTAAVIGVGGFLGIGEKSVGVPIEAIDVRTEEDGSVELVMQSTREELEAAPEFADLEDQMQEQQAERQEQERQQQMNQTTTAPATGTTN
jgi:sporulation protein YlmC with PRC-barrel domain